MYKSLILVLSNFLLTSTAFSQSIKKSDFSIGHTIEWKSSVLDENRIVNIYLPDSYARDTVRSYPVIYLLDGSRNEDFIHTAGLVQFCSFSWINIIEESIVVGIANVDRKRDFTYPSRDKEYVQKYPTTGGSAPFIQFVEQELQPLIEQQFRIQNNKRTIVGQSLGGLLATEILIKQPQLFDNYIIVSPSLWYDDESLLKKSFSEEVGVKNVYIGVGKEGPIMERVAKELFDKLSSQFGESLKLEYGFFEKQNHGDVLHLALYDGFEKIFKTTIQKE